jgi:protein TonB
MPDGSRFDAMPGLVPASPAAPRWGRATCLALLLHATVALPVVLALEPAPEAAMVEGVELALPMQESTTEAEETDAPAEAVATAPPDAAQAAATAPPETVQAAETPPEPVETAALPPETVAPVPPREVAPETPPETVMAEAPPPEPLPSPEPEAELAEVPPEERVTAALPPPPPPMPAPPRPVRPRVAPVAAPRHPPAPPGPPSEAPPNPTAAAAHAAPAQAPPRRPSAGYIGSLLAALERHKDYPLSARHRRAQGTAMLRFAMRRDGSVTQWRIERSSGDPELDAAVGQMVRLASPLPAPPAELPGDPIVLVVPVRFILR